MKTFVASALLGVSLLTSGSCFAQTMASLPKPVQELMNLPDYHHAFFALDVVSLQTGKTLYSWNPHLIMSPGSTQKVFSEGTALAILGPDFRFHTKIYRTGPIEAGTLKGDLVLVASGDPNLSGRIQPDGTMIFVDEDHSYGGPTAAPVAGDPLLVIKQLADQIAALGIKAIDGRVLVDISLFPEETEATGWGIRVSPIMVNDNIVDVQVIPASAPGAQAQLHVSPETAYVHFVNQTRTVAGNGNRGEGGGGRAGGGFSWGDETVAPDGTYTVTVTGNIPMGSTIWHGYHTKTPHRFAEVVLAEALRAHGIKVSLDGSSNDGSSKARPNFKALSAFYTQQNQVAEHVSPPLTEEAKVTLKVSQNYHASMMPYIIGAYAGQGRERSVILSGYATMRELMKKIGIDTTGVAASEGAGGGGSGYASDVMVDFLRWTAKQPYFQSFYKALPILGKDGTLVDAAVNSPGAGHVHAKTGTFGFRNLLNTGSIEDAKGLAGYIDDPNGGYDAFALYVNHVPMPDRPEGQRVNPGEELGQIASALYEALGQNPQGASGKRQAVSQR